MNKISSYYKILRIELPIAAVFCAVSAPLPQEFQGSRALFRIDTKFLRKGEKSQCTVSF